MLRLQSLGHSVAVLAGQRKGTLLSGFAWTSSRAATALTYSVRRERNVLDAVRASAVREPPDLAVVQLGDIGALCRIFASANIPTIAYIHDPQSFLAIDRQGWPSGITFAASSQFVADEVAKKIREPVSVIPVLIGPDIIASIRDDML